jgi:hypothetical protein
MKNFQIIFLWGIIPPSSSLFVRSEKHGEENAKKDQGSSSRARVKLIY